MRDPMAAGTGSPAPAKETKAKSHGGPQSGQDAPAATVK